MKSQSESDFLFTTFPCELRVELLKAHSSAISISLSYMSLRTFTLSESDYFIDIISQYFRIRFGKSGFFTARVRSTREGNIYTWECLSVHHRWGGGGGYPILGLDQGGTPGYHPGQVWIGRYPPMTGWGTPPPTSIASTWYAAGGMPLAFTQEDFLFFFF